jgi:hypothetical protein
MLYMGREKVSKSAFRDYASSLYNSSKHFLYVSISHISWFDFSPDWSIDIIPILRLLTT